MENFLSFNLPQQLMQSLELLQFKTPTPVQAQAIGPALEGKDILGSAQTGTGKTGAFGIPLVTKLMTTSRGSALVMTPTRELAVQVMKTLEGFLGKHSPIKTALLIGGESMHKQFQQLKSRPRLLVGTPGRINDHLERGSLMLNDASFLVLDETDRMLDMGFAQQIDRVLKYMPRQRQTLLFSATLPANIVTMAQKFLREPVRVSVGSTTEAIPQIKQETLHVSEEGRYDQLLAQLSQREGSVIVFVKTKRGADRIAKRLRQQKHGAEALHGNLNQNQRVRVITGFRECKYRILVATDIAARGLDIPHVRHVINFDLPQVPEDYIHRIGRTARAGAEGSAICFITPANAGLWRDIERLMNPGAKHERPQHRASHGSSNHANHGSGQKRNGKRRRFRNFRNSPAPRQKNNSVTAAV